jgi:hypothetical protein
MKNALLMVVVGIVLSGCSSTANLGLITKSSAKPSDIIEKQHLVREIGPAKGQVCRGFFAGLIPFGNSNLPKAVDKALIETGGDALVNVSVTTSLYGFMPIAYNVISFTCTTVEGVAIRIEEPSPLDL